MYDIIIVGAGPAGMTAAIYALRASKKVLILEKGSYGGQIISTLDIENYPAIEHISGADFAERLYNQVKNLGAEILFEEVTNIKITDNEKIVITNKDTYQGKTIIIATGTKNRKLDVDEGDRLIGKGVSYCATCDGRFYKNKDVAVVGGGNTALEDALYLSDIASKVYLIHRNDKFRGYTKTLENIKKKNNIEIILNSNVSKLISDDTLKAIEIVDNNDNKRVINVSGLFVGIGRIPLNNEVSNILELDDRGYVKASEDCHTNIDGVFVAGDNRTKSLRQLVTAESDGAVAATEAIKYIAKLN